MLKTIGSNKAAAKAYGSLSEEPEYEEDVEDWEQEILDMMSSANDEPDDYDD